MTASARTVIAFTGHRPEKLGGYELPNPTLDGLEAKLVAELQLIKPRGAVSGMAQGFDQLAARVCTRLSIPWVAAIPFPGQESRWRYEARLAYRELLQSALAVVTVNETDVPDAMQLRNVWMVDHTQLLVAAWNGSRGGTANCWRYAESIGRPCVNLFPW